MQLVPLISIEPSFRLNELCLLESLVFNIENRIQQHTNFKLSIDLYLKDYDRCIGWKGTSSYVLLQWVAAPC